MENKIGCGQSRAGQNIPPPLAVALEGGHKRQMRQAWRPGLAQVTLGQFDGMHGNPRNDQCLALLFLEPRKWHSDAGPNSALPAITLASMLPKLPFTHRLHGDTEGTAFGSLKSKGGIPSVSSCTT